MFARLQRADGQPILLLSSGWAGPERRSERSLGTCHDVLRQENITIPLSAYPGEFERLCHVASDFKNRLFRASRRSRSIGCSHGQ